MEIYMQPCHVRPVKVKLFKNKKKNFVDEIGKFVYTREKNNDISKIPKNRK